MKQKHLLSKLLLLVAVFVMGAGTVWASETYKKVTSSSEIVAGKQYVLVCESKNVAMKVYSSGTKCDAVEVTITNNTVSTVTDINVLTIEAGEDGWYFKQENGNYLYSSAAKNLKAENTTNKTLCTITDDFQITMGTSGKLQYNASSPRFCPYTSSQTAAYLYVKEGSSTPTCVTPTFNPAGGSYTSAQSVTISTTTEGATIYYTTDGNDPTENSNVYSDAINVSETTTIKAIAVADGYDNSSVATATYTIISFDHAGTEVDPYTVADARAAIDANTGTTGVYAIGVVSEIVEAYSSQYSNITFDIVDEGGTNTLRAYRCGGDDAADVQVGDVVIVSGNLTKYNVIYEFAQGCQLVSLTHPSATICADPVFSLAAGTYTAVQSVEITCATEGATIYYTTDGTEPSANNGTAYTEAIAVNASMTIKAIAVKEGLDNSSVVSAEYVIDLTPVITAANVELAYDATFGEIAYSVTNTVEGKTLSATTTAEWISDITVTADKVTFTTTANESTENRTATITLSYEGATDVNVTVTQKHFVIDYATLPFEFNSGKGDIASTTGLTQNGLGTDYSSSNAPNTKLKFDGTGDWVILKFNERPGTLSFTIKCNGNSFTGSTFDVETSVDGENFNVIKTYKDAVGDGSYEFNNLNENVRYIRWIFTEKGSGNIGLGNIKLAKYVEPSTDPSITVDPTLVEASAAETDGIITVTYNNLTDVLAEVQFFAEDGTNSATYNWITADINDDNNVEYLIETNDGAARTAYMKVYAVGNEGDVYSDLITITQAAYVPSVNYTLATAIVPGKHYIFASGTDGSVYAMGQKKSTNREAVVVTATNGTIALTGEENAYEFVINGPDANGNYVIYDESTSSTGYLYAAGGTGSNHLKVQANKDANAEWSISIDAEGVATIVANMEGRNWMRFNNGSSKIFSCYASGQEDIYLFEKNNDEVVTKTVNITDAKYATYCSDTALEFTGSGLTAYVAKTNANDDVVSFEEVTCVPANTGVLLKGEAGTKNINVVAASPAVSSNAFIGVTEATEITDPGIFVLMNGDKGVGFYKTTKAFTVGANTAYLPANVVAGARTFIGFDDAVTAIDGIAAEKMANGEVYNLQGQRVVKVQKGLYIMDGKKVLVK